jgi:hypothetical protein
MTLLIIVLIVAGIVAAVILNSKKKSSFSPQDVVSDNGADRPTVVLDETPVVTPVEPVVSDEELAKLAEAKKETKKKTAKKKLDAPVAEKKVIKKKSKK